MGYFYRYAPHRDQRPVYAGWARANNILVCKLEVEALFLYSSYLSHTALLSQNVVGYIINQICLFIDIFLNS